MPRMVSPNDMLAAAKEEMLDGRDPESRKDWALVMNFMAANVAREAAESACLLISSIYSMPLSDQEVKEIVKFQLERR